ncbi:MAG: hypothetical protein K2W82_07815 [Candidatus Obscuribacterales bacterium]|nr:hypothetical protein [Candidatus Obscuribacterales bacterium]
MSLARDSENQTKLSENDNSKDDTNSKPDGFDLVSLIKDDATKSPAENVDLAAAGSGIEFSGLLGEKNKSAKPSYTTAYNNALLEFPGNPEQKDGEEDPHAYPRELARRDNMGQELNERETTDLEVWRTLPGLDDGSTRARNILYAEMAASEKTPLTHEQTALLNSRLAFPNPDKRLDLARELSYLNQLDQLIPLAQPPAPGAPRLDINSLAELKGWESFSNPDPEFDRARTLIQKKFLESENESKLTPEEKAELASWIDIPNSGAKFDNLRKLYQQDFLYRDDPEKALKTADIAQLEAWKNFSNPDSRLNQARALAEEYILANYQGKELSSEKMTQLEAWATFPGLDKTSSAMREFMINARARGGELLPEEQALIEDALQSLQTERTESFGKCRYFDKLERLNQKPDDEKARDEQRWLPALSSPA